MAKGKWLASDTLHERTVKDMEGNEGTIQIREFSEEDFEARQDATMVKTGGKKGRGRGITGGMDYEFKLKNLRRFDLTEGLIGWDFEDDNGPIALPEIDKNAPPKDKREQRMNKLRVIMRLGSHISQQIWRHVKDLNDLDMEEDEDYEDDSTSSESSDPFGDSADFQSSGNGDPFADFDHPNTAANGGEVVPLGSPAEQS